MEDPRVEYLESVHEMDATVSHLLAACQLVQKLGPEGVVLVANNNPNIILESFTALAELISTQRDFIKTLIEQKFEIYDELEKLSNDLRNR